MSPPACETTHHELVRGGAAAALALREPGSVHLVVTSPPYPMVEMWDRAFADQGAGGADPWGCFEAQHRLLDAVWSGCARVLVEGGFCCVNVGDAVRTVDGVFRLYPNHARVLHGLRVAGLEPLPDILWRKPTNAPNKFMGSGMLPAGAYVTYEHEYVLIARKGGPRRFTDEARGVRRRSAYFWEERNRWFSDLWADLPGTEQALTAGRARSAAFPLELPFRLVQMYSVQGDLVLDPFAGTGTTLLAAAATGRSSLGMEVDDELVRVAGGALERAPEVGAALVDRRLGEHRAFVDGRLDAGRTFLHQNRTYEVPVVTAQETDLVFVRPVRMERATTGWSATLTAAVTGQVRLFG